MRPPKEKIIHLLSGGLDSVTALYKYCDTDWNPHCLLADYGQKHWRELGLAKWHCEKLGVPYTEIEISKAFRGDVMKSRLLAGADDDTPVVMNRNNMLLSWAVSIACSIGAPHVSIAVNADDAAVFPDCRKEFISAYNWMLVAAGLNVRLMTPFLTWTKREVAELARKMKVDINQTWSCYGAGPEPCGTCLACTTRAKALA